MQVFPILLREPWMNVKNILSHEKKQNTIHTQPYLSKNVVNYHPREKEKKMHEQFI